MDEGQTSEGSATKMSRRGDAQRAIVCAIGLGVLFGSLWSSRTAHLFDFDGSSSLARVVALLIFASIALSNMLRDDGGSTKRRYAGERPPGNSEIVLACCSVVPYILCIFISPLVSGGAPLFALGLVASLFEGISLAIIEYVLLWHASCFGYRTSAMLVATALFIANMYDAALSSSTSVATAQSVLSPVICTAFAAWLSRGQSDGSVAKTGEREHVNEGDDASFGQGSMDGSLANFFAASGLFCALMLSQGLAAQVTGMGAIGNSNAYGSAAYIIVIGLVRSLMLIGCALFSGELKPMFAASIGAALMLSGLVACSSFQLTDAREAASLAVEAAYSFMQCAVLILAVQGAHRNRPHAGTYLCVSAAVLFSNQVTRLLLYATGQGVGSIALFLACELSVLALVVYCAAITRMRSQLSLGPGTHASAFPRASIPLGGEAQSRGEAANVFDPLVGEELEHVRRLRAVSSEYGLTDRELEVVFQAVHGYTIDATAKILGLSRDTVKTHLSNAYHRCGVRGRQEFLDLMGETNLPK